MYRLLFQNGGAAKEPMVVDRPLLTIGRDAACQVQLHEGGVADRHARIERRADGYYLRDLDSLGGVLVNGERITERRLTSGDELEIGATRLRFEIVHGASSGQQRRPLDLLQLAAAAVVILVIGGQIALLSSIFSVSRPKKMKTDVGHGRRGQQAMTESNATAAPATPSISVLRPPASAASLAAAPAVLNRMIRIVRVDRSESGGAMTITVLTKAQVGERELDVAAVAMCVQFAVLSGTAPNIVWREPIWLSIPAWENFMSKAFTVRFPGAPQEMAGFVVRTYYRNQLQDIAAVPPSLRTLAPTPIPGGAP